MIATRPIRKAIFAALKADASLTSLIGGLFEEVPSSYEFKKRANGTLPKPYLLLAEVAETPWQTFDADGAEALITLHAYSRYAGASEAMDVAERVTALLDGVDLVVEGLGTVTVKREFAEVLRDDDADGPLRIGVIRFRMIVTAAQYAEPVASVAVTPLHTHIEPGATLQLTAEPRDANGTALLDRPVTWVSTDLSVATVDENGLVTGVGLGAAAIIAMSERIPGSAVVALELADELPPGAASILLDPSYVTLTALEPVSQLAATAFDADGAVMDRAITWTSLDPSMATVDQDGLVTWVGDTAGDAQVAIVAACDGAVAFAVASFEIPEHAFITAIPASIRGNLVFAALPHEGYASEIIRDVVSGFEAAYGSDPAVATSKPVYNAAAKALSCTNGQVATAFGIPRGHVVASLEYSAYAAVYPTGTPDTQNVFRMGSTAFSNQNFWTLSNTLSTKRVRFDCGNGVGGAYAQNTVVHATAIGDRWISLCGVLGAGQIQSFISANGTTTAATPTSGVTTSGAQGQNYHVTIANSNPALTTPTGAGANGLVGPCLIFNRRLTLDEFKELHNAVKAYGASIGAAYAAMDTTV